MKNNSEDFDPNYIMFFFPSGSGGDFLTNVWAYWTWDDWSIRGNGVNQFGGPSVRIGNDIVDGVVDLGKTVPFVTAHWPKHWNEYKDYYTGVKPFKDRIYRLVVEDRWSEHIINNSIMKCTGAEEIDYDKHGNPSTRLDATRTFRNQNRDGWIEHGLDGPLFKKIYWGDIFYGEGFIDLYRSWGLELTRFQIRETREIFRLYNKRNRIVWRSYNDAYPSKNYGLGDEEILYIPSRNEIGRYDPTLGNPNGHRRTFYHK